MSENTLHKNSQIKVRQSGIELLKIIAILLIVLSHCTQTLEKFVDFQAPTTDIQLLILRLLRFSGEIGNIIFVVCSSWFLLDSKGVKKNKAINLALDSQTISIGILAVFSIISLIYSFNVNFSIGFFLHHIFPDLFEEVWFVPCYIVFYLIHGYLNTVIKSLTAREHFGICIFIVFFYCILGVIGISPVFSQLLSFVMIYFIVGYIKRHLSIITTKKKAFLIGFISLFFVFVGAVIIKNFLALKISYFEKFPKIDNNMLSIFLFPMLLCLFFVFLNIDLKSRFVNYLSSCSLFVYCIHENALVRESLRPKIYELLIAKFGDDILLLYDLVFWIVLAILSFIAAALYKTVIHKFTSKFSLKLESLIIKCVDSVYDKIK